MTQLAVIGLGKLGLPLAACLAKYYKVIGIDKKDWRISLKEKGLSDLLDKVKINFYSNYRHINSCKVTFVIVPTPSLEEGEFSNKYIEEVLLELKTAKYMGLVAIVSTIMPGSIQSLSKKYKLKLIYNPTFIALGSVIDDLVNPSFILIGKQNKRDDSMLRVIYKKLCGKKVRFASMKPIEAEICKLSLNCFLTTKISFANAIGNLCDRVGADGKVVMEAIGMDKRVNPAYLKPGLGFGGPCFPRDNTAFAKFSIQNGILPVINMGVQSVNEVQPLHIIDKIKKLRIKKISIPDLSYKEGTDNQECSQLKIIHDELLREGYVITPKARWELNHGGLVCKR